MKISRRGDNRIEPSSKKENNSKPLVPFNRMLIRELATDAIGPPSLYHLLFHDSFVSIGSRNDMQKGVA